MFTLFDKKKIFYLNIANDYKCYMHKQEEWNIPEVCVSKST